MNNTGKKLSEIKKEVYDKLLIPEANRSPEYLAAITGLETDKIDYRKYETWDILLNRTYFLSKQNIVDFGIPGIIQIFFMPFIKTEYKRLLPTIKAERQRVGVSEPSEELELTFITESGIDKNGNLFDIIKILDHHGDSVFEQIFAYSDDADKQKRITRDLQLMTNFMLDGIGIYDLRLIRIPHAVSSSYDVYSFVTWKQLNKLYGYER